MTRDEMIAALDRPIVEDGDGYHCRICARAFATAKAVPVHELVHRREAGLAPPAVKGGRKAAPRSIVCGYDGCTERMARTSLPTHLMSRKHGLDRVVASFYARQRADEEQSRGLAVVNTPAVPEPEPVEASVLTDITADELVTGILNASVTDGLMPIRMLASVLALTAHTEAVLSELRKIRK